MHNNQTDHIGYKESAQPINADTSQYKNKV